MPLVLQGNMDSLDRLDGHRDDGGARGEKAAEEVNASTRRDESAKGRFEKNRSFFIV
jgi:hypothetical protein